MYISEMGNLTPLSSTYHPSLFIYMIKYCHESRVEMAVPYCFVFSSNWPSKQIFALLNKCLISLCYLNATQ